MTYDMEMNLDFEALRKNLKVNTFCSLFLYDVLGFRDCTTVNDATPEQLIAMARRRGINLDNYKLGKGEVVEVKKRKGFFWKRNK